MNITDETRINVMVYKGIGGYYSSHSSELKPEHCELVGYKLEELIRANDPSVREYSGLGRGFDNSDFYFTVHVVYPPGNQNFCIFLLLNKAAVKALEEARVNEDFDRLMAGEPPVNYHD